MRAIRKLAAAAPLLFFAGVVLFGGAGCAGFLAPADNEIRESLERVRRAKLARAVDMIDEVTTADWRFVSGERTLDRAAYRAWLSEQLARFPVESIATKITRIEVRGRFAEVSLRQTLVRTETDPVGVPVRWCLVSVENQEWVKTANGWRITRTQQWPQERTRLQK